MAARRLIGAARVRGGNNGGAGQTQGIGDHRNRAQAHGQGRHHRTEQKAEAGVQQAGGDGHADGVVDEGEAQVLLHVGHCRRRDGTGLHDAPQITLDQGELGAGHGHIRARPHRDAHIGCRQGRRIVDAIAGHGHTTPLGFELLDQFGLVLRFDAATHIVDAQRAPHGLGRRLCVTGGHHHVQAIGT